MSLIEVSETFENLKYLFYHRLSSVASYSKEINFFP